ncbi:hydroxylase for synthesis of 2-methylthio-cis-ribozeatin in tRNA [Bernardetia litoralis DSM 6794]|uniref:Hydroxylase for synthesis of 2-methylthio-cis-ribozeatin in tRNA n=1 Tax=Bernardetia litoralis (strain ATCC 23117 / DSM 6794 / NBRC 15988 / NCIMB 1366 / Fx l1 / Sio-4) TaxID=880071 RepID=I4AM65_BERLS|nr:tRNA-(ms[2]io[6]A)-hydroxylase [Bernardetia litoralis]AFM05050.1 hydroxylase for synthesis of 2-methylthio-cis-ribozeatin in tRNA [Bernardetia litoralis DSM 6794]
MLHLQLPTDPRWTELAQESIEAILTDHAYCEQKAASSCISLIVTYNHLPKLVDTLAPIVAEEWTHFEMVLEQLRKRNLIFGGKRKDEYALKLRNFMVKGGSEEMRLLDNLLVNALIEARSCERFKMLSNTMEDEELKKFYRELMVSEARHYTVFISLAKEYLPKEKVDKRWQEFLNYESEIMKSLELRGDRMH